MSCNQNYNTEKLREYENSPKYVHRLFIILRTNNDLKRKQLEINRLND